ncbi:hypothetical protein TELCIR_25200, partial [Teladorsagia circumcincta]
MSLLSLSTRQPDLLAQPVSDEENFKQTPNVTRLNLEAPKNTASAVPHELAGEESRTRNRVVDYVNAQRMLGGTAHAEQLLLYVCNIFINIHLFRPCAPCSLFKMCRN